MCFFAEQASGSLDSADAHWCRDYGCSKSLVAKGGGFMRRWLRMNMDSKPLTVEGSTEDEPPPVISKETRDVLSADIRFMAVLGMANGGLRGWGMGKGRVHSRN